MKNRFAIDPTKGSILTGMFLFAMPLMLQTLLTMLFSTADTMVIGRFGHAGAISAIGVSAAFINLIASLSSSLGGAVTAVLSRLLGEKNEVAYKRLINTLPLSGLVISLAITIPVLIFAKSFLTLLSCPNDIFSDALLYLRIYFLGLPLMTITGFLSAILYAEGNSFMPFLLQLISHAVNIILNLFFVIVLDLNILGVATATVIAQILLFFMTLRKVCNKERMVRLNLHALTLFDHMEPVWRLGIPAALEGAALNLSGVVISIFINHFDSLVIAANTVGQSIEGLIVVAFVGFENAAVVFIARNYGCKDFIRVKKAFYVTMVTVFFMTEIPGLILYRYNHFFTAFITTDPQIQDLASVRMFYMCCFFGLCGLMNVVSGCVRGLGDARLPLYISLFSSVGVRLTWILTIARKAGTIDMIYVSFPICWFLCAFLGTLAFSYRYRQLRT